MTEMPSNQEAREHPAEVRQVIPVDQAALQGRDLPPGPVEAPFLAVQQALAEARAADRQQAAEQAVGEL